MPGITPNTGTKISWTPLGTGAVQHTFLQNGTVHSQTMWNFSGGHMADTELAFARGGGYQAQAFDLWHEYIVQSRGIRPELHPKMFMELMNLSAHAFIGGAFAIHFTRERAGGAFSLDGAHSKGDTTLTVTQDPTAIPDLYLAGDVLRIEHPTEKFWLQYAVVTASRNSPALEVDIATTDGLIRDYPNGSLLIDLEGFQNCVQLGAGTAMRRRNANRGGMFDFSMKFRTFRS